MTPAAGTGGEAPLPLREQHRQETRQRIIDAARERFTAGGYGHTTMDAIAERAGVSRATLFNYFPSKQSLLLPLAAQVQEELVRPAVTAALRRWPGLIEALRVCFANAQEHLFGTLDLREALREAVLSAPPPSNPPAQREPDLIREILERAAAAGELRRDLDVPALARYISLLYLADLLTPEPEPEPASGDTPPGGRTERLLRFLAPALKGAGDSPAR
ncbi:MAG: TetR/AcrR family transcriptional regulator [Candidatus Dormiibacterota bacterium]